MTETTWTLRVTGKEGATRVFARRQAFSVGRPIEFDPESPLISALEYALGAVGAELVAGLQVFAKRRRVRLDRVEALVHGDVEHSLTYLDVVGESGSPRLRRIRVKAYVVTPDDEQVVRCLFDEVVGKLPLLTTLKAAVQLDVQMTLTT